MKQKLTIAVALLGLLSLGGCGFQPLYGTVGRDSSTVAALNEVAIASIADRSGQVLRNHLIDRLYHKGRPTDPHYDLVISLEESEAELGIRRDATASRARLDITAHYVLTQRPSGKVLLKADAVTHVSYNKLDAQYATLTAREDARARGLNELSEQIVNRLELQLGATSDATAATP